MPLFFRLSSLAVIGALALAGPVQAAEELLPPEPTTGEWIQDTLADDGLWFAESGNLEFEELAPDLGEYPRGRRWVRVIDGKPAWVTYYVPGEILGFEVDTHHYGALATEFHFAAGSSWRDLQPVEATAEEISGFAAKWMRLYRANSALPAGTQFLRIEFPTGEDAAAARLTEVWLRCRLGSAARSPFEPAEGFFSPSPEANPPAATPPPSPAKAEPATTGDVVVEPIVVAAFVMTPPAPPPPAPIFGPADVDPTPPAIAVVLPPRLSPVNLLADEAPLIPTAAVPVPPRSLFGKVATFFRRIF